MDLLNKAEMAAFYKSVEVIIAEATSAKYPLLYPGLTTGVPARKGVVDVGWLAQIPGIKEWVDERVVEMLAGQHIAVNIKLWESTLGIKRVDLEDDDYGFYTPLIQEMISTAKLHPDVLLAGLLNDIATNLCYDGKAMAAADHPGFDVNGGATTVDNTSVLTLTADHFNTARTALMKRYKKNQSLWNVGGRIKLVVPEDLRSAAEAIVEADIVSGSKNTNFGKADLVVVPGITSTTAWFLIYGDVTIGAFGFLDRVQTVVEKLDQSNMNETTFKTDACLIGTRGRYAMANLLWERLWYSTGAGA